MRTAPSALRHLLPIALLTACSGDPETDASGDDSSADDSAAADSEECETWQPLDDFVASFPDAFCDQNEGCEGSNYRDRAVCMQVTEAYAQCITFDPCLTAACVEALQRAERCGDYPPECDAALIGEDRC